MISFHNDPRLKDELLGLLTAYQFDNKIGDNTSEDSSEIGSGFECVLQSETKDPYDYSYLEEKYGIPVSVLGLEPDIFYYLDKELQQDWPICFVNSIPVGVPLNGVIAALVQQIWFKKRLSIFSLCPPDKKHVFIPMKNRLLLMQLCGPNRYCLATLLNWDDLPEWRALDDEDNKGDTQLSKLLIDTYASVRYIQWDIKDGPSLIPLLQCATQLFEYAAEQGACQRVCFNQELYKNEGISGINRQSKIESDYSRNEIKRIIHALYSCDLLEVLRQQKFLLK